MSDLTDSFKDIFKERISSPFYGSLIVSWLLWNWKIPYVTFFIDQSRLGDSTNKIDYILKHCDSAWYLVVFPLLSTAVIVLLMPYVTNGASWVTERFDTWRVNKKNEVQGKRLLTVEESLQLRIEIRDQEVKYSEIITKKDADNLLLRQQLELVSKEVQKIPESSDEAEKLNIEFTKFINNKQVSGYLERIDESVRNGYTLSYLPKDIINYYVAYELLVNTTSNFYKFTKKGEIFLKKYLKLQVDKS
jgi:hypothetical protein